jgi:hypothetical protein
MPLWMTARALAHRPRLQAAFLFAPVEIVETYKLVGSSAKEAERTLHATLRPHHVAVTRVRRIARYP